MPVEFDREIILIRNFPVPVTDVIRIQEELDAQLFDESVFRETHKKVAAAQVILTLDQYYAGYQKQYGEPPDRVDIGDVAWVYIPVPLFQDDVIIDIRSKEKPAGAIAWFRKRKIYSVNTNGRYRR